MNVIQTRITKIPQSEEGQIFAAALEGSLRDLGVFKSRTDSTVAITIEEEWHFQTEVAESEDKE